MCLYRWFDAPEATTARRCSEQQAWRAQYRVRVKMLELHAFSRHLLHCVVVHDPGSCVHIPSAQALMVNSPARRAAGLAGSNVPLGRPPGQMNFCQAHARRHAVRRHAVRWLLTALTAVHFGKRMHDGVSMSSWAPVVRPSCDSAVWVLSAGRMNHVSLPEGTQQSPSWCC
jgi:hypothetical protein